MSEVCRGLPADGPEITISPTAGVTEPTAVSDNFRREIIRWMAFIHCETGINEDSTWIFGGMESFEKTVLSTRSDEWRVSP
jgi:hypothetical protein